MLKVLPLLIAVATIAAVYGQKRLLFGMGSNAKGQLAQNDFTRPLKLYSTLGDSPVTHLCTSVSQQLSGQDVGFWRAVFINAAGQIYGYGNGIGGALLGLNNLYPTRSASLSVPTFIYQLPAAASAITCGERHVIITTTTNEVYGFGENEVGQMATGDTVAVYNVTALPKLKSYTKIWAVGTATFATDAAGNLYGVGANNLGQLGTVSGSTIVNMTLVPVPNTIAASGTDTIAHVTGSSEYTMYLTGAGNVYASGLDNNLYSRFGQNSLGTDIYPYYNYTLVISNIGIMETQLSSSIVVSKDGLSVYAWGDNTNGRLCLPLTLYGTKYVSPVPALITNFTNQAFKINRVKLGATHAIFETDTGAMYGCGDNTYNQIGADWSQAGWSQSPVGPLTTQIPTSLVAGSIIGAIPSATLLVSSQTVYGWGSANQLGFPQVFPSVFQINSTFDGVGMETINAGHQYSIVRLTNGSYFGFGSNSISNVISNTSLDFYVPREMLLYAANNFSYVATGGGPAPLPTAPLTIAATIYGVANTSTSTNVNTFYGYGMNDLSQLAQNTNQTQYRYPVPIRLPVTGNATAATLIYSKIEAGFAHGLALASTDGSNSFLYVWGSNSNGQIGLRVVVTRPTMLLTDNAVVDIAAGDYHSFYIKKATNKLTGVTKYTALGTGLNTAGQLGLGALQYSSDWLEVGGQLNGTASPLSNLTLYKIWTGTDQTWVLTSVGLYVMGDNSVGQLGLGPNVTTPTRQPILHPFAAFQTPDIVQVACAKSGGQHTAVITKKGDVYVMGRNDKGQLGLGDTVNRLVPTLIPRTVFSNDSGAVTDVVSASAGSDHTLLVVGRKDCPNNCNGRGECDTVSGQCSCYAEYLGTDCSLYQCPQPDCNLRGYCDTSIGICVCSPSALYSGLSCEKRRCTKDCSGRGRCDSSGVCKCDVGFSGLGCELTGNAYTIAVSWMLVALLFVFHL